MKKYIITLCIAFVSVCAFAQETEKQTSIWGKSLNFLGSLKYEIVAGYGGTLASEPYDEAAISYNLGVTARKEIISFKEDKADIYGIVGIFLTKRGGKKDDSVDALVDDNMRFRFPALSIPIHVGGEYRLKRISFFADLGPNLLFKTGDSANEYATTKTFAFGGGFNMGVRFKRFAWSVGYDQDFTNIGKDTRDADNPKSLKTAGMHMDLRWTIGK